MRGKLIKRLLAALLCFTILAPNLRAHAAELTAQQYFTNKVSAELKAYIKKAGGTVTLQYQDLTTGEGFQINGRTPGRAASTIKLPLALYVMEKASKGNINLNQRLTYKRYHYYGGSGIIQHKKVGTTFTIRELVKYAMIYSDNIAFIMLKEKVGPKNFIAYMKSLGAKYAYPNGQNLTSPSDLIIYTKKLYQFSQKSPLGKELDGYLRKSVYNTTIPRGIKNVAIAHKVGMIPESRIYNDAAVVYDKTPFALAIMTRNISYTKSQKVIADLAAIVYKNHKAKTAAPYIKSLKDVTIYSNTSKSKAIGTMKKGQTVKVNSRSGNWYVIQFGSGTGYIEKKSVIAMMTPVKVTVLTPTGSSTTPSTISD